MPFQPRFTVTPLMMRQLKAVEEARGFLAAVRASEAWATRLRRETQVRDALASVQIEGSSLTYESAFKLAESPPPQASDTELEFLNYLRAFEMIDGLRGERDYKVTSHDLLNIHRQLVDGVRGGQRYAGQFRRESVKVGDIEDGVETVHHEPPPWHEVEDHIRALFDWLDGAKHYPRAAKVIDGADDPWVHPVIAAGIAQHRLVWIHPFIDGNGRSARMLTTLLLYQRGYDFKYLFDLSGYYNRDRDRYYAMLRTVDRTGDYTQWLMYFMGGFSAQMFRIKEKAARLAEGVEQARRDDDDGDCDDGDGSDAAPLL
jgi:Fic family protein